MSEEDNLALWNQVRLTNPEYTKKASNGRFEFTTVDPQYQLQEATKLWGPYGSKWGLRDCRFTPIETGEVLSMMLEAEFFYPDGHFPIAVDLKFRPGSDCVKMLMTSARSKALSYLGFAADVFMGKFDDAAYVKDVGRTFSGSEAMDAFVKIAGAKIDAAKTTKDIEACEAKVISMLGDGTIDQASAEMLLDRCSLMKGAMKK